MASYTEAGTQTTISGDVECSRCSGEAQSGASKAESMGPVEAANEELERRIRDMFSNQETHLENIFESYFGSPPRNLPAKSINRARAGIRIDRLHSTRSTRPDQPGSASSESTTTAAGVQSSLLPYIPRETVTPVAASSNISQSGPGDIAPEAQRVYGVYDDEDYAGIQALYARQQAKDGKGIEIGQPGLGVSSRGPRRERMISIEPPIPQPR